MAYRIPQSDIDRIKQAVPLTGLCRKYGIELQPHGSANLAGLCPFHEEKTPSFIVTPKTNLFHCHGCGCGGSNFDLVMRMEKVSFIRAYDVLQECNGEGPATPALPTRLGTSRAILATPQENLSDAGLMRRTAEFYHATFCNRPQAMQYLQQRGCFHPEAVKKFFLGYANRTLGYRVPDTLEGRKLKERLQRLGILRASGHEHFNGCVIFPIANRAGQVVEMYGRRVTKTDPQSCSHLYLPGPHAGVWNDEELAASRVWIICEAALDALSWWCAGFRNVTWTYGVHGMSPDHWALIREVRPAKVILSQDNDEAGNKGAHGIAQQLEAEGIEAWRALPLPGRDINDLARSSKNLKDDLADLLAAATRLLPQSLRVAIPFAAPSAEPISSPSPSADPLAGPTSAAPAEPVPSLSENQAPAAPTVTGRAATEEKSIPLAAPSAADAPIFSTSDRAIIMTCGEPLGPDLVAKGRVWRIVGLENNTTYDRLKVNVRLSYRKAVHLDTFDLCLWRERKGFAAVAHQVTGLEAATAEADLAALVEHLQTLQQERLIAALKPVAAKAGVVISPDQESEAMAILKNPRMLDRVLSDLHKCGIVGEDKNLLISWLVSISRKLEKPLGICVMSRSAAGKSSLLDAVARFVPDEDKHQYTALTPQALFHMPENELVHKAIFIAEDVGAEGAAYSLKTIQSDGQLVIACTMKDEVSGQMVTKTKLVRGPVAVFLTSTNRSVDDELLNRLLLLTIDESMEQTERIHAAQRRAQTMQGIMERRMRPAIIALQQNLQRLIRPLLTSK